MDKPLYWTDTRNEAISLALEMYALSMYALGEDTIKIPTSYAEARMREHPNDPISLMFIFYTMLRADRKDAKFITQNGSLYLLSGNTFYSPAPVRDVDNDEGCDFSIIYTFAPAYTEIPSDLTGTIILFQPEVTDIENFSIIFDEILSSNLPWKDRIPELLSTMAVQPEEIDSTIDMLNRIIAKIKLQEGATRILDFYGCTFPLA